jgi:UDP-glucose 4-epimerase
LRALVTGGSGFIGSNLVDELLARGNEVVVLDDLSTGRRENLAQALEQGAELVEGDVVDTAAVSELVGRVRPDAVFHLAAQIDVRRSVAEPDFDASVNVVGTVNLLAALREIAPTAPFVFTSTGGAMYGEGEGRELPFPEDAAIEPLAPYGQSKLAGEGYVSFYRRVHGIPGVSLRLGNVFGPRQDPHGEAGVVAIFCGRLAERKPPTIFGDGRQTRDFVYVGDVAEAMISACERLASGGGEGVADVYNVGTGRETTVLELAERLGSLGGEEFEPEMAPAREGEIQRSSIDSRRAESDLDWHAQTSLDEGLRITLERT